MPKSEPDSVNIPCVRPVDLELPAPSPRKNFKQEIPKEQQNFCSHMTLGMLDKLKSVKMTRDVKIETSAPVDQMKLKTWERKNGVLLPEDLKKFYLSTNGIKFTWAMEYTSDNEANGGEMIVNSLEQLLLLVDKSDKAYNTDTGKSQINKTRVKQTASKSKISGVRGINMKPDSNKMNDHHSQNMTLKETVELLKMCKEKKCGSSYVPKLDGKVFALEPGQVRGGRTYIVFQQKNEISVAKCDHKNNTKARSTEWEPSIWFLDPAFDFHFLAPSFTHYYRMMLFHLGLPQWQFRFTPHGVSKWVEQMFWLFAPHLLEEPKISKFPDLYLAEGLWSTDIPDEAANPNPTTNELTSAVFRKKKRDKSSC